LLPAVISKLSESIIQRPSRLRRKCCLFAVAVSNDWELHQVDIKSAYLNAELKEEVYMVAPMGVLKPGEEGKVCKLQKALYRLKQAGHEWYKRLAVAFYNMSFSRSSVNHSVFFLNSEGAKLIVAVATDDMAVAGTPPSAVTKFK